MLERNDILKAIQHPHHHKLVSVTTLTIFDDAGDIKGYLSGDMLASILQGVLNDHLSKLNRLRTDRLTVLIQQPTIEFEDFVRIAVDPLYDALCGKEARIIHFCYEVMLANVINVSRQYWWTPAFSRVMTHHFPNLSHVVANHNCRTLNLLLYNMVKHCLYVSDLPLKGNKAKMNHELMLGFARATLSNGWDRP